MPERTAEQKQEFLERLTNMERKLTSIQALDWLALGRAVREAAQGPNIEFLLGYFGYVEMAS